MGQLKGKAKIFVDEYLVDLNASQAAIRAGYSKKTAGAIGKENLQKPAIKKEIDRRLQERSVKTDVRAEDIINELCRLAFVDLSKAYDKDGDLLPVHKIPKDIRHAIASIETGKFGTKKVKFYDKSKSIEMLGRHLKLFTDKLEHTGKDGQPLPQNTPQVIVMLPPKDKDPEENG